MPHPSTRLLHDLEALTWRSDPRFAQGLRTGRPRPPREYRGRRGPAWALLALSVVTLIAGAVLPQGLLLASGLVMAGMAVSVLAPADDLDRPAPPPSAPNRPGDGR